MPPNAVPRFWSKVVVLGKDDCWIYKGAKQNGYGIFWYLGSNIKAHIFSMMLVLGYRPKLCVCHSCDTPDCCNPKHLFLGTQSENRADCVTKGRQAKGESVNTARLTEQEVLEIRELRGKGVPLYKVAQKYGPYSTVQKAALGKTWKHLNAKVR